MECCAPSALLYLDSIVVLVMVNGASLKEYFDAARFERTKKKSRNCRLCRLDSGFLELRVRSRAGLDVPDVLGVFVDGSIGAEFSRTGGVHDRGLDPFLLVLPASVDTRLSIKIAGPVVGEEIEVVAIEERVQQRLEDISGTEHSALYLFHDALETSIHVRVAVPHVVASSLDLVRLGAEHEHVLLSHGVSDLNVGTVQRADDDATIEHELHVARAGSLGACSRDMLGDVVGRDDDLGSGHIVVGDEDHLEQIANGRVRIHDGADGVDELDDALGHHVRWGGFATEDAHARNDVCALIRAGVLDRVVSVDDTEDVEELALVLVNTLHLDVEQGVAVHLHPASPLNERGKPLLVLVLDLDPLTVQLRIVDVGAQGLQPVQVGDPLVVLDPASDELRQPWVALVQPAPGGDAVRFVLELVGPDGDEVGEERVLEDLGMDGCDTIDGERADDGQIGHADHLGRSVLHDAELGKLIPVSSPFFLDFNQPSAVNLENDLRVPRKQAREQIHRPLLQRLGQDSVVGVRECLCHDVPS
mmetsp:Transcript_15458/g.26591  ORF Transcript_15458/g.26591 Transcript_15458/m.26591 type:complete len:531 (+) Transcript_15458:357-1949(+)